MAGEENQVGAAMQHSDKGLASMRETLEWDSWDNSNKECHRRPGADP